MSLHDVCTEQEILGIAHAMLTSGLKDAGFDRVNLDDCWVAQERDANGRITYDTARFPSGIASLVGHLHDLGLKFGLYSSMGNTTCNNHGRTWPGLKNGTWPRHGSFGHYKEDAATFASWGVDYVKMDWCGVDEFHKDKSELLHRNFSHWLNATGRPMHLELCRGYPHPLPAYVAEVAQSWRVAGDNWDYWPHTVDTIKDFINASHLAGPYAWNYGDFLMTGGAGCNAFVPGQHCPGQNDAEYRTQFSVYVVAASPLIIGTDIRNMTPIMRQAFLNPELLEVNQDYRARPGDLVGSLNCSDAVSATPATLGNAAAAAAPVGICRALVPLAARTHATADSEVILIWARHLSNGDVAVAVTNTDDETRKVEVALSALGLPGGASVTARDLWLRSDLPGSVSGRLSATVGPHDTVFLRLRRAKVPRQH